MYAGMVMTSELLVPFDKDGLAKSRQREASGNDTNL